MTEQQRIADDLRGILEGVIAGQYGSGDEMDCESLNEALSDLQDSFEDRY